MCSKQQQHQQQCDCVLGVCSCSRDLTHDDPADDAAAADTDVVSDSSMSIPCSIDISSTSSFLPRVHPLFSKSRCLRTQQYANAKDQVPLATALFLRRITRVVMQLLSSISSAFNCSRWSKRLMPPLLPVRAFGAELNYLQALAHHAARANRAAETSGDEHTCVSLNAALSLHRTETSHFGAGVTLQDDSPTSIYRGGWFISPNIEHAAAPSVASPVSLGPLDFWYAHSPL